MTARAVRYTGRSEIAERCRLSSPLRTPPGPVVRGYLSPRLETNAPVSEAEHCLYPTLTRADETFTDTWNTQAGSSSVVRRRAFGEGN